MTTQNIHAASNAGIAKALAAEPKSSNPAGVVKRSTMNFLDARKVGRKQGWNKRFDFGAIEDLAKSLAANGMLNPIRVHRLAKPAALVLDASTGIYVLDESTSGEYLFELIDGDRRLHALELLIKQGKYDAAFPDGVPATIVDKSQDWTTSMVQRHEANTAKPLLPLEEAADFKQMRDGDEALGIPKHTIKQICAKLGHSSRHVTETLALLDADDSVQEAVKSGAIGRTEAKDIAVAAKGDKAKQKELVEKAKNAKGDKKAKREVKDAVRRVHVQKAAAKGKTLKIRALSDQALSELGQSVAEALVSNLKSLGLELDKDLLGWIKKDKELQAAYQFGALVALRAAAGASEDLLVAE